MEEQMLIQTAEFELSQLDFLIRMLVAIGIGLAIGLEREYSSLVDQRKSFAGIRTFTMVVLTGFVAAFLNAAFFPWIFIFGLAAITLLSGLAYWLTARQGDIGGTTEIAGILAYLLGGMVLYGFIEVSLALTVIVLVLLSSKVRFKAIVGRITQQEIYAFVTFVVVALLIFPFLPNTTYGPYNVFNPRELGWVIVLTSGVGFAGYLLMKFLGSDRGILLTGIVGGLVSSTVVTWVFSKKSKEVPALSENCIVAILAASTIMVIRVLVWVFLFNKNLLNGLKLPIAIVFLAGLGAATYFYRKHKRSERKVEAELPLGSPLNLRDAVFFGVLYSGILLLVSFANEQFGASGIYISSAIAALTDIDAITISVSKLGGVTIPALAAQNAILLATLCNTVVKIGIAFWSGSKELRWFILTGYGVIFLAGLVGFVVLNLTS